MPAGKPRKFKTPQDLYNKFQEYIKWVDDNPWIKKEAIKSGEMCGQLIDVPYQRPYTLTGFAVFCKCCLQTIENYGNKDMYPEYFGVFKEMETTFTSQKFEGAVVGSFNAHIIARDLGLKDKSEIDHNINDVSDALDKAKARAKKAKDE